MSPRAVILAGGRGTRLAPYTTAFPKPLMPVGDRPILELLLMRLRAAGVMHTTLAVGHLAQLIRAYFGDGENLDVEIEYSYETEPLGTAGPLRLVDGLDETFLVMNGDLLTDLDFEELLRSHRESGVVATIGTYARSVQIDLGVLDLGLDGCIAGYREKPRFDFHVSMGIYALEPEVLKYLPATGRVDLPDLISALLAAGERVSAFVHDGYWLDIGRPDDYAKAQEDVANVLGRLGLDPAA